jgi:uncharacterized RDD family membrane protein YckC
MKIYETFWRRVGARLIDAVVLCPLTIVSFVALARGMALSTYVTLSLFTALLTGAYSVFMTARYGQTLGKMATGVKIIRLDGTPIALKDALYRVLPECFIGIGIFLFTIVVLSDESVISMAQIAPLSPWISGFNWVWIIAQLITVGSNQRRRAIHDYVADTQVVVIKYVESVTCATPAQIPPTL